MYISNVKPVWKYLSSHNLMWKLLLWKSISNGSIVQFCEIYISMPKIIRNRTEPLQTLFLWTICSFLQVCISFSGMCICVFYLFVNPNWNYNLVLPLRIAQNVWLESIWQISKAFYSQFVSPLRVGLRDNLFLFSATHYIALVIPKWHKFCKPFLKTQIYALKLLYIL